MPSFAQLELLSASPTNFGPFIIPLKARSPSPPVMPVALAEPLPQTNFFSLPAEVRNEIYEEVLEDGCPPSHLSLLLANKQVYAETHLLGFSSASWNIQSPFSKASQRLTTQHLDAINHISLAANRLRDTHFAAYVRPMDTKYPGTIVLPPGVLFMRILFDFLSAVTLQLTPRHNMTVSLTHNGVVPDHSHFREVIPMGPPYFRMLTRHYEDKKLPDQEGWRMLNVSEEWREGEENIAAGRVGRVGAKEITLATTEPGSAWRTVTLKLICVEGEHTIRG